MAARQPRRERVGEHAAGRCRAGDDGVGAEVFGALHDRASTPPLVDDAHVLGPDAELQVGAGPGAATMFIGGVPMKRAANTVAGRA